MATVTCPAGHESTTDDYCDTCGAPIAAATAGEAEATEAEAAGRGRSGCRRRPSPYLRARAAASRWCGRFCESCGYDVEKGAPGGPAAVSLVLGADRAHWERMVGSGEPAFPAAVPTLSFELTGDRAVLGRVRTGAPVDVDLALTGSAADPAVSHHQCEFERDGEHVDRPRPRQRQRHVDQRCRRAAGRRRHPHARSQRPHPDGRLDLPDRAGRPAGGRPDPT